LEGREAKPQTAVLFVCGTGRAKLAEHDRDCLYAELSCRIGKPGCCFEGFTVLI